MMPAINRVEAEQVVVDTAEAAACADFLTRYPQFAQTGVLDRLRATEYARLDEQDHVYLDYTGGGLYAQSQLDAHMALLGSNVFGNPHSHNPTSMAMTDLVEESRRAVLDYFNASPGEYVVIFTPNASGALKLVGESYPFQPGGHFALCADDHNSVNGIREFARARGAGVTYVPVGYPALRMDPGELDKALAQGDPGRPRLLAYPGQSNFSGVKHPLEWIKLARDRGWDVLLDAAAFVPTNRLDLARYRPDFVSISFYKMFGYPTGVGALLARREALAKLRRPWFAGGTVKIVSVKAGKHYLVDGDAGFEDGTVNYLALPAVKIGLDHISQIGIDVIHQRVICLTGWLLESLIGLQHGNGQPLVEILGPTNLEMRGGAITFKLTDPGGTPIDSNRVEELAAHSHISLRTGCFCNPGAGETAHGISKAAMEEVFILPGGMNFGQLVDHARAEMGVNVNAVRLSVGLVTNFRDVYRLRAFLAEFLNHSSAQIGTGNADEIDLYQRDAA